MELQELIYNPADPLSIQTLVINIGIGFIISLVLRKHFMVFGSTLSNRHELASVFPFILLTTLLIIMIVKSSLALSLGLVGALSIVRFRTPIKEPEELAYLFIAIAIGLGLGANQVIPTIIGSFLILALMAILGKNKINLSNKNIYLSLDIPSVDTNYLDQLNSIISMHTLSYDLRRYDLRDNSISATYFIDVSSVEMLSNLSDDLAANIEDVALTFLDQNQMPSI
jgi:hypothetical protein